MSKKDFDEFIKSQIASRIDEQSDTNPMDWEKQKEDWLEYLSNFYQKVEEFLAEYLENKALTLEYSEKDITEEYIGHYIARVLNIKLGRYKLKFDPIGTLLLGAKGRVDLIGVNGSVTFVLVDKTLSRPRVKVDVWIDGEDTPSNPKVAPSVIEWNWKIVTRPPSIQYIDFGQEEFLSALLEVSGV